MSMSGNFLDAYHSLPPSQHSRPTPARQSSPSRKSRSPRRCKSVGSPEQNLSNESNKEQVEGEDLWRVPTLADRLKAARLNQEAHKAHVNTIYKERCALTQQLSMIKMNRSIERLNWNRTDNTLSRVGKASRREAAIREAGRR